MIAVVKYNAGNVYSVMNALKRIGADAVLTDDESVILSSDKVIFPGVGEASTAMAYLKERGLDYVLSNLRQPFLGICLGMQLMTRHSDEGDVDLLSIFPDDEVLRFPKNTNFKVPHVGWNTIKCIDCDLFYKVEKDSYVYFVHSYYVPQSKSSIAITNYDCVDFSAAISRDNYYGLQFHPEKSGAVGEQILRNFVERVK